MVRVVIAMSGGVDSSVAAALLKDAGYDCIGMHLRFWNDPAASCVPENKCCSAESRENAKATADALGIPFHVFNVEVPFKKHVVDYFLQTYKEGKTPNPCVECNRNIKFGVLMRKMEELGADYVATGHYVRKLKTKKHELWMAKDKTKDQSYFLYHLGQDKLPWILFPLGDYTKREVFKLARKFGLAHAREKKESQDICFFAERTPHEFLKRHLDGKARLPGPIMTTNREVIGVHEGLPFYTIGQRKGIKIGGASGPWFVVKIDRKRNALIVGKKEDLLRKSLEVSDLSFVSGKIPKKDAWIDVKIRYRFPPQRAKLYVNLGKGRPAGTVIFEKPVAGISPGQSAVFYDGEKMLGGGKIMR